MRHSWLCCLLSVLLLFGKQAAAQNFQSHATVNITGQTYSYTLFDDEPANSSNFATEFLLSASAPFTVTGTPAGWSYQTDNTSYVLWGNNDTSLPYPHDVAPGASLSGFAITAIAPSISSPSIYQVYSWDHAADTLGPNSHAATILAPAPVPAVPEVSTGTSLGFGLVTLSFGLSLKARKRRKTIK